MEEKEDEIEFDEPHLGQIMQAPPEANGYNGDKEENTDRDTERE